jgi:glutathione S-transferase
LFPFRLEADIEELLSAIQELEKRWYPCVLAEEKPELLAYTEAPVKDIREAFVRDELPQHLAPFEQQLATNGPFLLRKCTVADLCLQPLLVEIVSADFVGDPLAPFPSLKKWMTLVLLEVEHDDGSSLQSPLASRANSATWESGSSPGDQDRFSEGGRSFWGRRANRAQTE